MKKILRLSSVSNDTPGATATLEMPIGPTYERIVFVATAAAGLGVAVINRITVLIDGKPVQTFKNLQRLVHINSYYNRDADSIAATRLEFALHFNRAELVDNTFRRAPGIGTADVQTFHVEIEIASGAPADINLTAYAQVDPVKQPLGAFFKVREFPASTSVAGSFEADKLPRGAWYSAIHLFKSDVNSVEVEANGVKIMDATKEVLERLQKGASPKARVPVTSSATHVDFILDGDLLDSLPTANLQDFRVKMNLTTSGSVDIVTETLDTLS